MSMPDETTPQLPDNALRLRRGPGLPLTERVTKLVSDLENVGKQFQELVKQFQDLRRAVEDLRSSV